MKARKKKSSDREIEMDVTVRPLPVAGTEEFAFTKRLTLLSVRVQGRGTFVISMIDGVPRLTQRYCENLSCQEAVQEFVRDALVKALRDSKLGQLIAQELRKR